MKGIKWIFFIFLLATTLTVQTGWCEKYYSLHSDQKTVDYSDLNGNHETFVTTGFRGRANVLDPRVVCEKEHPDGYIEDPVQMMNFCGEGDPFFDGEFSVPDGYDGNNGTLPEGVVGWKMYIPKGTTHLFFTIFVPNSAQYAVAARFRTPPTTTSLSSDYWSYNTSSRTLEELAAGDCIQINNDGGVDLINSGGYDVQEGGWLYVRKIIGDNFKSVSCSITPHVEPYNEWYSTAAFYETDTALYYAGDPMEGTSPPPVTNDEIQVTLITDISGVSSVVSGATVGVYDSTKTNYIGPANEDTYNKGTYSITGVDPDNETYVIVASKTYFKDLEKLTQREITSYDLNMELDCEETDSYTGVTPALIIKPYTDLTCLLEGAIVRNALITVTPVFSSEKIVDDVQIPSGESYYAVTDSIVDGGKYRIEVKWMYNGEMLDYKYTEVTATSSALEVKIPMGFGDSDMIRIARDLQIMSGVRETKPEYVEPSQ